jgi:ankyrin repeat protein
MWLHTGFHNRSARHRMFLLSLSRTQPLLEASCASSTSSSLRLLGWPDLQHAVAYGNVDDVKSLLSKQAPINAADWLGSTALHLCRWAGEV